jgi:hypothetical protein
MLNRREVKTACIEKLRLMYMFLCFTYSNPIDIDVNIEGRALLVINKNLIEGA